LPLLSPDLPYVRIADQLSALLVPEVKRQAAQAGAQSDGLYLLKQPLALVALLQVVFGMRGSDDECDGSRYWPRTIAAREVA
jgi:hypothetical protein